MPVTSVTPYIDNRTLTIVADFAARADLAAYQVHPEHQAVVAFVSQIVAERRLIDYETD